MQSQLGKDSHLTEQIQILRQDVLKKNLEIVKLQDELNGKESRSITESLADSSRRRSSPTPERQRVQFSLMDLNMDESLGTGEAEQQKVIEDLKSKLNAVTEVCKQQERHFSNLVKDLEHKLNETISGRDELLTLRQQESLSQQQLIYQLQAALQQNSKTLEMRNEEISVCDKRVKVDKEKLTQAQSALLKVFNVLKNEESKRGSTNMLTGVTTDNHSLYTEEFLTQVLSSILTDDDRNISDLIVKNQEIEQQLQNLKEAHELDKTNLIREYETKLVDSETDHAKSLDIAANRTLTERSRITELVRDINENRLKYEKTIDDHEKVIATLEENIEAYRVELHDKNKKHEIQRNKDVVLRKKLENQLENLRAEKEQLSNNMLEIKTASEDEVKELALKLRNVDEKHKDNEKELLGKIVQLKETVEEREEDITRIKKEHEAELKLKTDKISSLEKDKGSELFERMENNHNECRKQLLTLKEELKHKTDEVLKLMEECRRLRERIDKSQDEKSAILAEKEELNTNFKNLSEKMLRIQDEKSRLSNMVRENVDDLTRAKDVINSLQVELDAREKSLEVFNKQESKLAELLFQKHLVGESLLVERQQIVGFLEEKVQENEKLKGTRDALAQNLESKIQVLAEMEATFRSMETKLEVRSNELEVIMEDRNKAVREVENKVVELTKLREERDSLVTLMNGKQSEKDKEITKLLSRLKGSQHDLAMTRKVLEAKREANEKATKLASATQEEITAKRKEVDSLKDRIKWLQDSLQATAEEKVHFERKASELTTELRDKNQENENIREEFDKIMKYYDNASGQVTQMEMALEKAGIKFAESQALVEKLEQDLAKIKLQYSLEVKELELKVKSAEGREQNVQVVKPFRFQHGGDAGLQGYPANGMAIAKNELDATKQRLTEETEMTEGFKTLLKDLHELMKNMKDSSIMLKRGSDAGKKTPRKVKSEVPKKAEGKETVATTRQSKNEPARIQDDGNNKDSYTSTTVAASDTLPGPSGSNGIGRGKELKRRKSRTKSVNPPLHSSSPKSSSPVLFDKDTSNNSTSDLNYSYSDISDVESDCSGDKQQRTGKRTLEILSSPRPRDARTFHKSKQLKGKIHSHIEPEDVDSLLMPQELPPRSHRRAKKILDLLSLKGQALTNGNKSAVTNLMVL
ncbi:coiled-coil domain-containing protein 158-like [Dendronephthya gigantea]|uniref:coiled-coil domain-containing protein 158-like n=1 Tax=Dendronephthya gigantea TaxID=151771 RepID=UPI00106A4BBA|nr:coiled-coil domain-containing protein 158-like [Dendronephthya gigantea]